MLEKPRALEVAHWLLDGRSLQKNNLSALIRTVNSALPTNLTSVLIDALITKSGNRICQLFEHLENFFHSAPFSSVIFKYFEKEADLTQDTLLRATVRACALMENFDTSTPQSDSKIYSVPDGTPCPPQPGRRLKSIEKLLRRAQACSIGLERCSENKLLTVPNCRPCAGEIVVSKCIQFMLELPTRIGQATTKTGPCTI